MNNKDDNKDEDENNLRSINNSYNDTNRKKGAKQDSIESAMMAMEDQDK